MIPSAEDFLRALGKLHTDAEVIDLLNRLDLRQSKIKLKRGDFDLPLDSPDKGIDIVFSDPRSYADTTALPEGALVLSTIFFFCEGCQNHRQYDGALPAHLTFNMSQKQVRKLLGSPVETSEHFPVDSWIWKGIELAVEYHDSLSSVALVSCSLPKII